jgi:hypothetical protein
MVKIEGYLEQKDYRELIQYFWSKRCNSVDRPTVEACEEVVKSLEKLEQILFKK